MGVRRAVQMRINNKKTMSLYNKVSLGFARLNNARLAAFGGNVITKLTANPFFPAPPVPIPDAQAGLTKLEKAMVDGAKGGSIARAALRNEREAFLLILRQLASYVQSAAAGDLPTLLSAGFEAVKTTRTQIPLPQPAVLKIENIATTQLALHISPLLTARSYEVRMRTGNGAWQPVAISPKSRGIVVSNLTPGTVYEFQVRAVGGTNGYSDWSDPVSHMSL